MYYWYGLCLECDTDLIALGLGCVGVVGVVGCVSRGGDGGEMIFSEYLFGVLGVFGVL